VVRVVDGPAVIVYGVVSAQTQKAVELFVRREGARVTRRYVRAP
jgi:hypothetical protein